jgi:hypothetical protein
MRDFALATDFSMKFKAAERSVFGCEQIGSLERDDLEHEIRCQVAGMGTPRPARLLHGCTHWTGGFSTVPATNTPPCGGTCTTSRASSATIGLDNYAQRHPQAATGQQRDCWRRRRYSAEFKASVIQAR